MRKYDHLIFDLNGTLYERGIPVEGAIETINVLRKKGYHLSFVTNTDGRSIKDVHRKIVHMGFDIEIEEMLTPVSAAKQFIQLNKDKSFYLLVDEDLNEDLKEATINETNPDYVIIGDFSRKLDYDIINKVFRMIKKGAEIIALSKTLWYVDVDGDSINTGAFVRMFEIACDKKAILLGKPSCQFLSMALLRVGSTVDKTMVIGDDIKTDIFGGRSLGATTAQVKTGVYDSLEENDLRADYLLENVNDIVRLLEK